MPESRTVVVGPLGVVAALRAVEGAGDDDLRTLHGGEALLGLDGGRSRGRDGLGGGGGSGSCEDDMLALLRVSKFGASWSSSSFGSRPVMQWSFPFREPCVKSESRRVRWRRDIPRAMGAMKSAMRKGTAAAMGTVAARPTRTAVTFIVYCVADVRRGLEREGFGGGGMREPREDGRAKTYIYTGETVRLVETGRV